MGYRLFTFGGLRLEVDGSVVSGPPAQRRRLALLALLAAGEQRKLTREKVVGYLWPEQPTARARHLLSESLYVLRRTIGPDVIMNAQDELVLDPTVLESDVVAFREGLAAGALADAVELYRGPFLDGFFLNDVPEFEHWADTRREALAREYAGALESLARDATAARDAVASVEWWRRLAAHDPYSSRVAGLYMEALTAAGERARALRHAATHVERLRDLGLEPDPGFQATVARLHPPTPGASAAPNAPLARPAAAPLAPVEDEAPVEVATPIEAPPVQPAAMNAGVPGKAASVRRPFRRPAIALAGLASVALTVPFAARFLASPPVELGAIRALTFEPGIELQPALSPDGRYVAYAGGTPSRIYLRQVGSQPVPLVPVDGGPAQARPRWSPDGEQIAFDAGGRVQLIPALGGQPRELIADGWNPAWSPDGERIAFLRDDTVFTTPVRGGPAVRLADVREPADLAWSPDGRWLALSAGNDAWDGLIHVGNIAPSRIVLIDVANGRRVEVTDRGAMNVAPVWLPDSRTLLFISNRDGARDVYSIRIGRDGRPVGTPARISTGLNAHSLALSTDGTRLVYATYHGRVNIWSVRLPTDGLASLDQAVARTTGNQLIESIAVSPDRRWVHFTSDRAGSSDIWRMPLPGGDAVQVTRDPADEFGPAQSPDGEWLAYYSMRTGNRDLWLQPTGPGEPVQLTDDPGEDHAPHWSPDGSTICYSQESGSTSYSLRLLRRQGAGWSEPIVPPDENGDPNHLLGCLGWLPDGRMVVQDPGRTMVGLLPVDGGRVDTLYAGDPVRGRPRPLWVRADPRSGRILFRDWLSIWTIDPFDRLPREIVRFDDPARRSTRIEMDTDGEHVFFSLGDPQSDLFVADVSLPGANRRSR